MYPTGDKSQGTCFQFLLTADKADGEYRKGLSVWSAAFFQDLEEVARKIVLLYDFIE